MNDDKFDYESIGDAVLRIPSIGYGELSIILNDQNKLNAFIRSEKFKEALFYASPELYYELIKYLEGRLNKKESSKIQNSIVKYIERMGARCTPFASFASCGVVRIDRDCNLNFTGEFKMHFRYDMQFLCMIADRLLKNDIGIYDRMCYVKNPTLIKVGTNYKYDSQSYSGGIESFDIESTGILNFVLKKSSKPITYRRLEEFVNREYEIESSAFLAYVYRLSISGILLNTLTPSVIGFQYFDRLYSISECLKDNNVREYFKFLKNCIRTLNSDCGFAGRLSILEDIYSRSKEMKLPVSRKSIVQVDCTFSNEVLCFPKALSESIIGYMPLYSKLMPKYGNSRLNTFVSKFESRYEGQMMPLLEVLNPETGIGYGGSIVNKIPLLDEIKLPVRSGSGISQLSLTPFQKILLNRLCEVNRQDGRKLVISDDDLKNIPESSIDDLPLSMAAMFKIVGRKNGEYLIGGLHYSGNSAINMLSRFCDGDRRLLEMCVKLAENEQELSGETLICEISHLSQPRTGNILQRPRMRSHSINYLTAPEEEMNEILLCDIYVSIRRGRVVLTLKDGRIIEPRLTNAHNFNGNTTPLYKFLCDMQLSQRRTGLVLGWGGLKNIVSHLPRVRYKNLIISYERWIIDVESFMDGKEYDVSKFRECCNRLGVCRKVRLIEGDNTLYVDILNNLSVEALFSAIKSSKKITLEEYLPADDESAEYGIPAVNECIIPLLKVKK